MITLICGLPRAGKTTYSERFRDVLHLDSYGYNGVMRRVAKTDGDVVVDGVYQNATYRKKLIEAYKGAGRRCIYIDTPLEVRRTRPGFDKFCDFPFEPPTYAEGWDEIIVIGDDNVESSNHTDET